MVREVFQQQLGHLHKKLLQAFKGDLGGSIMDKTQPFAEAADRWIAAAVPATPNLSYTEYISTCHPLNMFWLAQQCQACQTSKHQACSSCFVAMRYSSFTQNCDLVVVVR